MLVCFYYKVHQTYKQLVYAKKRTSISANGALVHKSLLIDIGMYPRSVNFTADLAEVYRCVSEGNISIHVKQLGY